jgi:transcriptional regulator with AAA-type ATPase domain
MKLAIIQFEKGKPSLLRKSLLDTSDDLSAAQHTLSSPCVWIVPNTELQELARLSDLIDDRGVKHKAKELSRVLLHGDGITMLDGDFSSAGKLRQSVEHFLGKVAVSPPRLFIVGTTDEIFSRLKKDAYIPNPQANDSSDQCLPARPFRGVLPLLKPMSVPEELRRKYLGNSQETEEVRQLILRAATIDDAVLITGDTGTGKEIVAREIHRNSKHRSAPFIPVNCGALPGELFESELFGHEKGAFTGANGKKTGLWRAADGGTLFLDEIGDLPLELQAKVLRTLQENKVRSVGSEREIEVHARVIAATNRDLFAMVQTDAFREDLYYRLRGFLIHTPALREHPEDIPLLAIAIWRRISGDSRTELPVAVTSVLSGYSWPGNVRELKMVLTHLHGLFGNEPALEERHLQAVFAMQGQETPRRKPKLPIVLTLTSQRFAAFSRLRRTYEAVRAAEHLLREILNRSTERIDDAGITMRIPVLLNELDILCRYPLSFTSATFESVNILRSRLSYFSGCLAENPTQARSDLVESEQEIFRLAESLLLKDIDDVMQGM